MNYRTKEHSSRGFTLTELAIVIGVVGTFLAGTWAAYGIVMKKVKINRAADQMATFVANLKKTFPRGYHPYSSGGDITVNLVDANVFPQSMIAPCTQLDGWTGAYQNAASNCAGLPDLRAKIHTDPMSTFAGAPNGTRYIPIWIMLSANDCPAFMAAIMQRIPGRTLVWGQVSTAAIDNVALPYTTGSGHSGIMIDRSTTPEVFSNCGGAHAGIVIDLR